MVKMLEWLNSSKIYGFKYLAAKPSKHFLFLIYFDEHSSITPQDFPFFLSKGADNF